MDLGVASLHCTELILKRVRLRGFANGTHIISSN